MTGEEEKTELLPTGWNDKDNYALRYVLDTKLFILHGLNTDGNLIVNLMVNILGMCNKQINFMISTVFLIQSQVKCIETISFTALCL